MPNVIHAPPEPPFGEDPIVAEVRAIRDQIAASVGYDLDSLYERLRRVEDAERAAGREVLPPEPAAPAGRADAA